MIERILRHVRVWGPTPPLRAPPVEDDWPNESQIPLRSCQKQLPDFMLVEMQISSLNLS